MPDTLLHDTPAPALPQADQVAVLLRTRQTHLPRRLGAPGPNRAQLAAILDAAAHAPDHKGLLPWRFILVPQAARPALGDVFARAVLERDARAPLEQVEQAREKAFRAPVLVLAVVDGRTVEEGVPLHERIVSAGCAMQNMLLMATAYGFGSALTSGQSLQSPLLRALFALRDGEQALCFVSIGSVQSNKASRARPAPAQYVATLQPQGGVVAGFVLPKPPPAPPAPAVVPWPVQP